MSRPDSVEACLERLLEELEGDEPKESPDFDSWLRSCPECHRTVTVRIAEGQIRLSCETPACDEQSILSAVGFADGVHRANQTALCEAGDAEGALVTGTPEVSRASELSVDSEIAMRDERAEFSELAEVAESTVFAEDAEASGTAESAGWPDDSIGLEGPVGTGVSGDNTPKNKSPLSTSPESQSLDRLQQAIRDTLPQRKVSGEALDRSAFRLVRHLRSVPDLDRPFSEVEKKVNEVLEIWHEQAAERAPELDEVKLLVEDKWDRVTTPIDQGVLEQAGRDAIQNPYRPEELGAGLPSQVAALCRNLRDENGAFFLSESFGAKALSRPNSKKSVGIALRKLKRAGYIECTRTGDNAPGKSNRLASEYVWIGPLD